MDTQNGRTHINNEISSRQSQNTYVNQVKTPSREYIATIWAERAQALAKPVMEEMKGESLHLLTFLLGGELYGFEVRYVREIHPPEQPTPVPRTPDFVVGVFNSRGRLISVVDLAAFFSLPQPKMSEDSNIIVVEDGDLTVGFLVDCVIDVTKIFKEELEPPLTTEDSRNSTFSLGIGPDMMTVLNLETLLNNKSLIVQEEII